MDSSYWCFEIVKQLGNEMYSFESLPKQCLIGLHIPRFEGPNDLGHFTSPVDSVGM